MVATACLFLSGKVEETPKKLRDVILVTDSIHNKHRRLDPEGDVNIFSYFLFTLF